MDGDTIKVRLDSGPITIRLHGIDSPEDSQPFGKAATKALRARVEGQPIEIEPIEQSDSWGRMVARVLVDGDDVGARMIGSGYAWAYRQYLGRGPRDQDYCRLEAAARSSKRGIWSAAPAEWEPPWDYRHRRAGDDAGARAGYAGETAETCIAALGRRGSAAADSRTAIGAPADEGCRIKGNINARGDRIYHVPGGPSYAATRIDTSRGERWFCSTREAELAGWRPPRQ